MDINDFKKIKEQLEKERKVNNEKINLCDERTRMSKVNSFEYKAVATLGFSIVSYLVVFLISVPLIKDIGGTVFKNVIPVLSYPVIVVGSSLGMGTLFRTLMYKKYQAKKRLKDFSSAKTQAEKLEEEIYYQIELEKVSNRNLVIDEVINVLNSNESMLREISGKYDVSYKNISKNEESLRKKIEGLSDFVKEQYDKLDILSAQKVLHDRFWRNRSKIQKGLDMMVVSSITSVFVMFLTVYPLTLVSEAIAYSSATIFAPFVASIVGISTYMVKRNKDHRKVFNVFNSQLGENALPELLDKSWNNAYEEQEELKSLIETQIRDTSLALMRLKEEQQVLDSMISNKEFESKIESKVKAQEECLLLPKEEVRLYQQASPILFNSETTFDTADESQVHYKKGPTLVKKR